MTIKRLEISPQRWPWQDGYNWHGTSRFAPLNCPGPGAKASPRFGGGWKYKLGITVGGWSENGISIILDLIFGMVRIRYRTRKGVEAERQWREEAEQRKREREVAIATALRQSAPDVATDDVPF